MEIVERLLAGDVRALARAISIVEQGTPTGASVLQAIYRRTGEATVLGFTGAPGSGKSCLVDRMIGYYRGQARRVGVVAVDPSSAFSGGAILGDRVRMQDHALDPGVFIRSMATRGHLGGLARATSDVIDLLDAAGFDPILVETVGVGQDEVEIVRSADVVAVVLIPGMGDDIQAIKAGILEIADLFVLNKSDRDGIDRLQADLEWMLSLADDGRPKPSIHRTVALRGEGISDLADGIRSFVNGAGTKRRGQRWRERAEARFLALVGEYAVARVRREILGADGFARLVDDIAERRVDPYSAAQRVMDRLEVR